MSRAGSQHLTSSFLKLHVNLQERLMCELSYLFLLYRSIDRCENNNNVSQDSDQRIRSVCFSGVFSVDVSWQDLWRSSSLSLGVGVAYLPSTCSPAPDSVFNAHTCSAAVHQLIHLQQKEMNSPSALCFSGVSDSVSQTWA